MGVKPPQPCLTHEAPPHGMGTSAILHLPCSFWHISEMYLFSRKYGRYQSPLELHSQKLLALKSLLLKALLELSLPWGAETSWEVLAEPQIQGSPGLSAFPGFLEKSCRSDSNSYPETSAEITVQPRDKLGPTEWNRSTSILFGEYKAEGIFSLSEKKKCSSPIDLEHKLLWNTDIPIAQESHASAPRLCNKYLKITPSSTQVNCGHSSAIWISFADWL